MFVEFPHTAPKGYSYEQVPFKRNVVAIWIHNHRKFSYNNGGTATSIWGFYNTKTKCFHSPINSKTVGNQVNIEDTSPYSAMVPKLSPLEKAFV
jgi:hypothetical protein